MLDFHQSAGRFDFLAGGDGESSDFSYLVYLQDEADVND